MNKKAFTLIEIMVGILIFSIVIVGGFQALGAVTIGKVRLVNKSNTQKQIINFSEKLFEEIKKGGVIDHEEYFNRKIVGTTFGSGHYDIPTGFGNFGNDGNIGSTDYGDSFYYCKSLDLEKITSTGCTTKFNSGSIDYNGKPQRYGQYSFQFIDYNSNYNNDGGDEDGDGNIIGDDDDEYLGKGPKTFDIGTDIKELYLISGDKTKRTLFRWNVKRDPLAPIGVNCAIDGNNVITGTGCLGTIEFLKLEGKDRGMNHDKNIQDMWTYDGVIDTWLIHKDFRGVNEQISGTDNKNYWVQLFPDTMNVTSFKIYVYPNKDLNMSWRDNDININVSDYARIQLSILPSRETKRKLQGKQKEINFSTTIALSDMFSK